MHLSRELDSSVTRRFHVFNEIGDGAYGVVFKASEKKNKTLVALKKQVGAFNTVQDSLRTYRELRVLRAVKGFPCLVQLQTTIRTTNIKDVIFVFDLWDRCMSSDIEANGAWMDNSKISRVAYSLCLGLKGLHQAGFVHRDMKPLNVLLDDDKEEWACIADMGLAATQSSLEIVDPDELVGSTASLWYMSPETLTGSHPYSTKSDIWGVGCIVAEACLGQPVFAGKSRGDVLNNICKILGKPSEESIMRWSAPSSMKWKRCPDFPGADFTQMFPQLDQNGISFLQACLCLDPDNRISAEEALNHPFLSSIKTDLASCSPELQTQKHWASTVRPSSPEFDAYGENHDISELRSAVFEYCEEPDEGCTCSVQ